MGMQRTLPGDGVIIDIFIKQLHRERQFLDDVPDVRFDALGRVSWVEGELFQAWEPGMEDFEEVLEINEMSNKMNLQGKAFDAIKSGPVRRWQSKKVRFRIHESEQL